jgi:hypothetical protein
VSIDSKTILGRVAEVFDANFHRFVTAFGLRTVRAEKPIPAGEERAEVAFVSRSIAEW